MSNSSAAQRIASASGLDLDAWHQEIHYDLFSEDDINKNCLQSSDIQLLMHDGIIPNKGATHIYACPECRDLVSVIVPSDISLTDFIQTAVFRYNQQAIQPSRNVGAGLADVFKFLPKGSYSTQEWIENAVIAIVSIVIMIIPLAIVCHAIEQNIATKIPSLESNVKVKSYSHTVEDFKKEFASQQDLGVDNSRDLARYNAALRDREESFRLLALVIGQLAAFKEENNEKTLASAFSDPSKSLHYVVGEKELQLSVAIAKLEESLQSGRRFMGTLESLLRLGVDDVGIRTAVDRLRPVAITGTPKVSSLELKLDLAEQAASSIVVGKSRLSLGTIGKMLSEFLSIYPKNQRIVTDLERIRIAQEALLFNELDEAISVLTPMAESGNDIVREWIAEARQRLDVQRTLRFLQDRLKLLLNEK